MTAVPKLDPVRVRRLSVAVNNRPRRRPDPPWVKSLVWIRQVMFAGVALGFILLGAGYWWIFETQRQWAADHSRLQQLALSTQQLEWNTALLEGQLTPEQTKVLVPARPDQFLLVPPAQERPWKPVPATPPELKPIPPLGY